MTRARPGLARAAGAVVAALAALAAMPAATASASTAPPPHVAMTLPDVNSPAAATATSSSSGLSGAPPAASTVDAHDGTPAHAGPPAAVSGAAVTAPASASAPAAAQKWPVSLIVMLAGVFLALLAVALVGIGSLRQIDRGRALAQQMERYGARHAPAPTQGEGKVARTVLAWGTRALQTSNAEPRLARRLDLAGIARSPAQWVVLGASACLALAAGFSLLLGSAVGIVPGVLAGWLGMRLFLSLRIARRRAVFGEQLPDVLQLIAGSLQAGFSLPQALDAVVREGTQPTAAEFSRALAEARIGIDLAVALDEVADRMESDDLRWTVMAIRIQREVGGNLAEILRNTVGTMRERAFLRRHVRALSAEGRLSAYILIALPLFVGTWLFISNGSYMRPLYTTVFGLILLIGGSVLMVVGSIWMRNLINMEV